MALRNLQPGRQGFTYVPVLTNGLNVQSSAVLGTWKVQVVDGIVSVHGKLSVDPTAAALTVVDFSLPFPVDLTDGNDITGIALSAVGSFGGVVANTTDNRAQLGFVAQGTAAEALDVAFAYNAEQ